MIMRKNKAACEQEAKKDLSAVNHSQKIMMGNVAQTIIDALTVSEVEAVASSVVNQAKPEPDQILRQRSHDLERIDEVVSKTIGRGCLNLGCAIRRSDFSHWFEVPDEEIFQMPKEHLEMEILVRHIAVELILKKWLEEWGYDVGTGEESAGNEDIVFFPDIYAIRETLYGIFEVNIHFICDNSPDVYKTRSSLETLESYALNGFQFSERDVLIIVTCFRFGSDRIQALTNRNPSEKYTVLTLEGHDMNRLQEKPDSERLRELRKLVNVHRFCCL